MPRKREQGSIYYSSFEATLSKDGQVFWQQKRVVDKVKINGQWVDRASLPEKKGSKHGRNRSKSNL